MSGVGSARVIRYRATTPEDAQRAFDEDRERVRAFGFVPLGSSWDQGEAQPTLVVEYRYDARARPTRTPASRSDGVDPRATSRRPGGLAQAILIVGVIMAGLALLAVSIPAAVPPAVSPPAASAVTSAAP